MDEPLQLGRRGFIGTSLAMVAGASLGLGLASASRSRLPRGVHLETPLGVFPEAPLTVRVALPEVREGVRGQAWLRIETPRDQLTRPLGVVSFRHGEAAIETTLGYPYTRRVAGTYRYYVDIEAQGERLTVEAPATYALRAIAWFS